ncbi:AcvB/VirJ family lysyl-phosphatidylglycerol hydrolase [Methylopila sp. M107]|uniref:AcvB/VirJ family lysyl-phosphatidylglycerol hydrolase n=1 Tax=Methylopila sp. M107 TaxID=1101190 RepID=UPI00036D7A43|nr:AcvB/VirJ family lysyl-phosphatidylglycerol hydrolase [Methylopila sp. M107]
MRRGSLALLALVMLAVPAAADDLRRTTVGNETLSGAPVVAPAGEPSAIVVLISDLDGWTPARAAEADAYAKAGAMAIGVDLPKYLEGIAREKDGCTYLAGDIEEYGRLAGKEMAMKAYRLPVLVGVGKGADVVYGMLAQAPANMFAGAVSLGFSGRIPTTKTLCDSPKTQRHEGPDLVLGNDTPQQLQGEWRVLTKGPASDFIKGYVNDLPTADYVEEAPDADMAAEAQAAALELGGGSSDAVKNLPLVLYPPTGPTPKGLAVIYAGDGGWRDLDKSIAGYFQQEGYGVVGVDTLRYFWNEKSPKEMGDDLEAIVGRYAKDWKTNRILLGGYSFGADVIPFAWGNVSKQVRDRVKLIALLGLSKTADFEVSVSGWLGVGSGDHDVLKPASQMPMDKVLCMYGQDEIAEPDNDVACATDAIDPKARVQLPGGHHFDGNYEKLAERIDAEFMKRTGAAKKAP